MASQVFYLNGEVPYNGDVVTLGILPAGNWVTRHGLAVLTAYNDSGTDNIKLGHSDDDDAYFTNTTVDTTGTKSPSDGTGFNVYDSSSRTVKATYTGQNGDATQGRAIVYIEYTLHGT